VTYGQHVQCGSPNAAEFSSIYLKAGAHWLTYNELRFSGDCCHKELGCKCLKRYRPLRRPKCSIDVLTSLQMLANWCVYAIKSRADLHEAATKGTATFIEKKRWAVAARLLEEAQRNSDNLAIVFAAAEKTNELIAWGLLDKIEVGESTTSYTFSDVKLFEGRRPRKTELRKRSDGQPLDRGTSGRTRYAPRPRSSERRRRNLGAGLIWVCVENCRLTFSLRSSGDYGREYLRDLSPVTDSLRSGDRTRDHFRQPARQVS
jgi:hypothetical protein